MAYELIKAGVDDLGLVYDFELCSIEEIEPMQVECWKNAEPALRRQWTENLDRMYFLKDGEKVLGYFFWQIEGESAVLASIFVPKECRGNGLGQQLLKAFEEDAKTQGFEVVELSVFETNPARFLYEKAMYEYVETRNSYRYYRKYL